MSHSAEFRLKKNLCPALAPVVTWGMPTPQKFLKFCNLYRTEIKTEAKAAVAIKTKGMEKYMVIQVTVISPRRRLTWLFDTNNT